MKVTLIRYHEDSLINTRLPESINRIQGLFPPLGIAYIASALEKGGYEVNIIDAPALNISRDGIKQLILRDNPDLIGVTTTTATIHGALEACQAARECEKIVVIGGVNLEIFPRETLSFPFIDFGIQGEGEESLLCLLKALEGKFSFRDVPGLIFREDGEILINPPAIVSDIDNIPFPARHLLPMHRYSSVIAMHPATIMISSRGCPHKCSFCYKQAIDKKIRYRNPISVVDEMEQLVRDYKMREILFYDEAFTSRRDHVEKICREILKRKIKILWESTARVDEIDIDLLKIMAEAGCIRLRYGVESGDPEILERMNKKITPDMIKKTFRLTREAGIRTLAYFQVGYPGETEKSFRNTIALARELDLDFATFTITTPYPGTPLFDECARSGIVDQDYWRNFILGSQKNRIPFLEPDAPARIKRAYRSFYFRPGYILERLKKLDSWETLKNNFKGLKGLLDFRMTPEDR